MWSGFVCGFVLGIAKMTRMMTHACVYMTVSARILLASLNSHVGDGYLKSEMDPRQRLHFSHSSAVPVPVNGSELFDPNSVLLPRSSIEWMLNRIYTELRSYHIE